VNPHPGEPLSANAKRPEIKRFSGCARKLKRTTGDPLEEAPGSSGAKPRPPNLTPVEWLAPSEIDRPDRKAATRRHEQAAFVVAVTRDRKLQLELEAIDLPQRAIGIRITRL